MKQLDSSFSVQSNAISSLSGCADTGNESDTSSLFSSNYTLNTSLHGSHWIHFDDRERELGIAFALKKLQLPDSKSRTFSNNTDKETTQCQSAMSSRILQPLNGPFKGDNSEHT